VYDLLTQDGYHVAVVQNPTLSLAGDAAAARLIIDAQGGPVILAGHSYGGAVITEAGTDPNVAGLVYIAAFVPDQGESVNTLIAGFPQDGPQPPILPPTDGFLFLDRDKFHDSFAGDVPAGQAAFMADSQVPWGLDALGGTITEPAWRAKPSWYLLTTEDKMIPPPAQRDMSGRAGATVTEAAASHSVYVSQPAAVATIINRPRRRWPHGNSHGIIAGPEHMYRTLFRLLGSGRRARLRPCRGCRSGARRASRGASSGEPVRAGRASVAGWCLGRRSLGLWVCLPEAGQGPPQLSA
jgi:hypothetical protein